tara:strand:+ start:1066 stop:1389 length:324 start_codon:yes stop_codon:yes gene_type:complete
MDDLTPIVIDLEKAKEKDLDESFLRMFGWGIKKLLKAVLGDVSIPVNLKGNPSDVKSFLGALGAEKSYVRNIKDFGLNNPRTYKSKSALNRAVTGFERKTGIKWPFK